MSESVSVPGPAGKLETIVDETIDATTVAVLCHPHSEYGGSMHDGVLQIMVDALLPLGIHCVRFNFRGVGKSSGQFDNGEGEIRDVIAVTQWAKSRWPGLKLMLGGYSFGAAMSLIAASKIEDNVDKLILIAPPIQMMASDGALSIDSCVIVGGRDTIVSASAAAQYFGAQLKVLPQADHFFSGAGTEISKLIQEFLNGAT
ncbi:MAG: alpha/beta superfamily hydrolase [Patiriisocius sp.]